MSKLKNVVVLDEKVLKAIANGEKKFDNRKNNTGRPVNKTSERQKRLAKQAFYADVNNQFKKGNQFKVNRGDYSTYAYKPSNDNLDSLGCIVSSNGSFVCNVSYVGRTKVTGFTYVLDKCVKVELNLKTLQFVK